MTQPNRFRANWEMAESSFCCGAREVGSLQIDIILPTYKPYWDGKEVPNPLYNDASLDAVGLWEKELPKMRSNAGSRPIMFNLVVDFEETKDLRTLLNAQEDCYHVHTWKNPGTGSLLEMYVLTNGSSETNSNYEEYYGDDDH